MTKTEDPSDSRELVESALKRWGWTCGPDFWDRYIQDPWVFNLVNALTRTTFEVEQLQGLVAELTDSSECWYDHHGYCQAHNGGERPCAHERAKARSSK